MEDTKNWYKSKTVWAGIITALIGTLALFGVTVQDNPETIADSVVNLIATVSGIVAIFGRVTAKQTIGS